MQTARKKIIIDTDTASDDAVALVAALRDPTLQVLAITAVAGNVELPLAVKNALLSVERAGTYRPPVYVGAAGPLLCELETADQIHGADGMGDLGTLGEPTLAPTPGHGADALARYADQGEVELLTLGPLTNVALAIRKHPEAMRKLRHITIMGGAHPYHNPHTVCAEFNIMVDPEAAQIVFSFGVPITLVTLEACGGAAELDDAAMERMRGTGEIGRFCVDCNRTLTELARAQGGVPSLGLPDPAALAVLARPELIRESFPAHTRVETQGEFTRGATVFCKPGNLYSPAFGDEPAPENSLVVTGLDVAGFHQYLLDRVAE